MVCMLAFVPDEHLMYIFHFLLRKLSYLVYAQTRPIL